MCSALFLFLFMMEMWHFVLIHIVWLNFISSVYCSVSECLSWVDLNFLNFLFESLLFSYCYCYLVIVNLNFWLFWLNHCYLVIVLTVSKIFTVVIVVWKVYHGLICIFWIFCLNLCYLVIVLRVQSIVFEFFTIFIVVWTVYHGLISIFGLFCLNLCYSVIVLRA